ncbi:hypothetical protein [Synechococcus sp. CBW1006]|uniref:hypothetical protein n=1 Tax=Synechococcus sp. CBW1006 TaxID=1353138 RepID=UPI0018CD7F95|nr:hypothetical protein [Synechococcus sp. CBW1006]QPN65832.1 hypothetical protein H8F26_13140 [Synechococcus sp. CBW1006]
MTKTLIVHIGTGKTGSTAIQKHLSKIKNNLVKDDIHYFGLNLEHIPLKAAFPWQQPGGIGILQRMPTEKARAELEQVLTEKLAQLGQSSTAVWSNESIYERPELYIPLLQGLESKGMSRVRVIAYARNMQAYILAAYKQWGIRHKTNKGPIMGFSEWVRTRKSFLEYGKKMSIWLTAFGDFFSLYNYDCIDDVVEHFLVHIPGSKPHLPGPRKQRENVSPTEASLALYALYNNQFIEPALPDAVSALLSKYELENSRLQALSLSGLYPSPEEVSQIVRIFSEDMNLVNEILDSKGQPMLQDPTASLAVSSPSELDVLKTIASILLELTIKIDKQVQVLADRVVLLERANQRRNHDHEK